MTFRDLQQKADAVFPALLLENLFPHKIRVKIRKWIFYVLIVTFILSISNVVTNLFPSVEAFELLSAHVYNLRGLFFITFVLWFVLYLYELLYFSYYFKSDEMDFEVAKIVNATKPQDISAGFLQSTLGSYAMKRLGITKPMIERFLATRSHMITIDEYEIILPKNASTITLAEYGRTLIHFDNELAVYLQKHGISPTMFRETLRWVSRTVKKVRKREMWWSRENLTRIPTIGRNWSFGKIYLLERYGHSIYMEESYIELGDTWRLYTDYVERMESVLVKNTGANIMLTVDETASGLDIVSSLAKMIVAGMIHPALENKRMFILDPQIVLEAADTRTEFEALFRDILAQSANAGNVVLVVPHFDSFLENAHGMSVDVSAILSDSLRSTNLQMIALTSNTGYSATVEPHKDIVNEFTKVVVEDLDKDKVIELLEDEIHRLESHNAIFFTYPAVVQVVSGAEKFYPDQLLSNTAFNVLSEIIPHAFADGLSLVSKEYVQEFFKQTTGVPQGPMSDEEQEGLLKLEDTLHKRVVGQDAAIDAVATSLRRSRAGLTNPKRPMGSFLFLGPTGVGKTETVKALTEALFGDETDSIRLDMSEFQGVDAVAKLIGTGSTPGILEIKVRERPYGVLLLDEFEKASTDIHNLFLQILDEGFFTTGGNEKVHLRNMIIVATSNAGSSKIFDFVSDNGKLPDDAKNQLIDILVNDNQFKPELINRFDDVVVFSPLTDEELKEIATLMITKLNTRMAHKGISVTSNDVLLTYLMEIGSDKEFGARAMNRAIQDSVERLIADGIIGGSIQNGDTVEFALVDNELEIKKD